jgi:hypothetical protein
MPEKQHSIEQWLNRIGQVIDIKFKELEDRIVYLEEKTGHKLSVTQTNSEVSGVKKEDCFYFAGVTNGTFSKPSLESEEYSLYRFVKIDENKCHVYVENTLNAARKFANNTDAQESACEQLNQCPENPSGIKTIAPGEAIALEGNKWRIVTKVKIEYLN